MHEIAKYITAEMQLFDCNLKQKIKHTLCIVYIDINANHLISTFINQWKETLFYTLLTDKISQPTIALIVTAINKKRSNNNNNNK